MPTTPLFDDDADNVCLIINLFIQAGIENSETLLDCINYQIFQWCTSDPIASARYAVHVLSCSGEEFLHWKERTRTFFDEGEFKNVNKRFNVLLDRSAKKIMLGQLYEHILAVLYQRNSKILPPLPRSITETVIQLVGNDTDGFFCDLYCIYGEFLSIQGDGRGYVPPSVPFALAPTYRYLHYLDYLTTNSSANNADRLRLSRRNALVESDGSYCPIIAYPPFGVDIPDDQFDQSLLPESFQTRRSELLYPLLGLRLLREGGRCGMILPISVVESSDNTYQEFRKYLVENSCVEAIIYLPSNMHKDFINTNCVLLMFSKGQETDSVFFYRRDDLLECEDFPRVLDDWANQSTPNALADKSKKYFVVPRTEIEQNGYDLSFARYHKLEETHIDIEPVNDFVDEFQ